MLILSEKDVNQSISMHEAINVMEEAFIIYAKKDFIMPARSFATVKDEDTFALMPCIVDDSIGLKVVSSFPSNSKRNIPVTSGVIFINDKETGQPLALMNGTLLTAVKTAAVSGVAMRLLKKDAKSVGLIGTGLQGMYQLIAALNSTSVEKIHLYNRSPEKVTGFIKEFKELSGSDVEVHNVEQVEELVKASDIIITATTSLTPVIPNESDMYENKLIIGVGSFKKNMRELPEELFKRAPNYFIDSKDGKNESGDIIDPIANNWINEEKVILLSDVITGNAECELSEGDPIIFKNVSMALFDTLIGNYVYKKAQSLNIGTKVEI